MKKHKFANYYSSEKIKDGKIIRDENGFLFSHGVYPTQISPDDLPEWYVYGYYYRVHGYLSAKGVVELLYKPNMTFNHMLKDDFLYISYKDKITEEKMDWYTFYNGYDYLVHGRNIISFLKAVEKYSGYDISVIKEQIEAKRKWFMAEFPEDYKHEVGKDEPLI